MITPNGKRNRFYRTIWQFHFYSGLIALPILCVLALTGAIYLFKPQYDQWVYHSQLNVVPKSTTVSDEQLIRTSLNETHAEKILSFRPPQRADRSVEVGVARSDGDRLTVFIDPYEGRVLGTRDERKNFQQWVREIHGKLMLGDLGDHIVELTAVWALLLLVSGLYLAWPLRLPKIRPGKRVFWRDLHLVVGTYSSTIIAFLVLTGLPWSGVLGNRVIQSWNHFPEGLWSNYPESTVPTRTLNQGGPQVVPWAVEKVPLARSQAPAPTTTSPVSLRFLMELAKKEQMPEGYVIQFPKDETGVFTLSGLPNDPRKERTIHIDQYSGEVLSRISWSDYAPIAKAVEGGIALHTGKMFGLPNQIVMLLGCLGLLGLSFSGVAMGWKRRLQGAFNRTV